MDLDELKTAWASDDETLDRSIAIAPIPPHRRGLGSTWPALFAFVAKTFLELAIAVGLLALLGRFVAQHMDAPRFLASALVLVAFLVVMTASLVRQLVLASQLDYAGPVTAIQRVIERMKLETYRQTKWAVLGACLLWVPMLVVLLQALVGVDLFQLVSLAWVLANIALGVVVLAIGLPLSRRYVEHPDLGPRARRLVHHASGYYLRRVTEFLDELERFEGDGDDGPSAAA